MTDAMGSPLSTTLSADGVGQRAVARNSRRGAFALAGVALAGLVAVLLVVGLVQSRPARTGELTESQLLPGDCLTGSNMGLDTSNPWPNTVTAVPCTQRHIAEVFYVGYPWPASLATYPGLSAVNNTIDDRCTTAFVAYVGPGASLSMLTYDEIGPSGDWATGDREVVCVAYEQGTSPLYHSIKGTYK